MKPEIKAYSRNELTLKLLTQGDLQDTLRWRNHHDHRIWFNTTNIISSDEHEKWFSCYLTRSNDLVFIVCGNLEEKYGQLSIYDINWEKNNATYGRFLVNPAYAGKGLMKEACKIGLQFAREILQLVELTLEVKADNTRAIHIYKQGGFVVMAPQTSHLLNMRIDL